MVFLNKKAALSLEGMENKYSSEFEGVSIYINLYDVTEASTYIGLFYMFMDFISIMAFFGIILPNLPMRLMK